MDELWSPDTLVRTTESVHTAVSDRYADVYDGVTERGPGSFTIVVPNKDADYVDDYVDDMDALPWAGDHPAGYEEVYIHTQDDVAKLFQKIDAFHDGAVLVQGDGSIYDHTVQITPDVTLDDAYEDGWGTKTRTAIDVSAVSVSDEETSDDYSDIVAITTSSATGETRVFSGGECIRHHEGAAEKQNVDAIWERILADGETPNK